MKYRNKERENEMKIGDKIQFNYLKEQVKDNSAGWNNELVDYSATSESYTGTVVEVRDIIEHPVSQETIHRGNIKGSRSRSLVTLELDNGDIKGFYDGRMVGTQVLPKTKMGLFRKMASAFGG